MATIPTAGSITSEEAIESIDALKWTLSNGITVIAKQTDFKNDEIVFGAFSPGGHSLVDDADHVSAQYAASLIGGSGVGPHDNVALDKLLAGKRVSVSPYISELFEGFNGRTSPEDMETLFQLINLYATEPRLDPVVYSNYATSLRSLAETRADQPDAVFSDTLNTVLSQSHFRRRLLTLELIEELSMERAEAVYADRFADLGDAHLRVRRRLRLGHPAIVDGYLLGQPADHRACRAMAGRRGRSTARVGGARRPQRHRTS